MRNVFDYQCQIHIVDDKDDIIQTVAEIDSFTAARACFDAYATTRSHARIQFRERSRIVETVLTGAYDHKLGRSEIVQRWR